MPCQYVVKKGDDLYCGRVWFRIPRPGLCEDNKGCPWLAEVKPRQEEKRERRKRGAEEEQGAGDK